MSCDPSRVFQPGRSCQALHLLRAILILLRLMYEKASGSERVTGPGMGLQMWEDDGLALYQARSSVILLTRR